MAAILFRTQCAKRGLRYLILTQSATGPQPILLVYRTIDYCNEFSIHSKLMTLILWSTDQYEFNQYTEKNASWHLFGHL